MLKAMKKRRLSRQPARSPESPISRLLKTPRPTRKLSSPSRRLVRAVPSAETRMQKPELAHSMQSGAVSTVTLRRAKQLPKALPDNVVFDENSQFTKADRSYFRWCE